MALCNCYSRLPKKVALNHTTTHSPTANDNMDHLKSYFEEQLPLSDVQPLLDCFSVSKILRKGDKLVTPGQRTSFLAFTNKGAFRVYFLNDKGQEITSWFSFERMFITDLVSYYKDTPASQFIEAIEDSELFIAHWSLKK